MASPAPILMENDEPGNPTTPVGANTNINGSAAKVRKPLLHRFITLSSAEAQEDDMRMELQYPRKKERLYRDLHSQQKEIQTVVASHCGLENPDLVQLSNMLGSDEKLQWLHGSFNVCIPICINNSVKVAFRVPLPYKIGEDTYPGNAEEKLRSEVATYIWVNKNCPDVPIPKLRGFGLPGGLSFFEPKFVSPWQRIKTYTWRFLHRLCGSPAFCEYIPHKRTTFLEHGYMIIDWIETSDSSQTLLAHTFHTPHTEAQTENLYRSISKIMISLAKIPQPRIGSWTIDDSGRISLSNRPMFCHLHQLENWAIPTDIPRDMTYVNADSLYLDLFAGHDNRLQYQENSVFNELDAREQATDLVLMKALLSKFTNRHLRDGPFVMQLTDLFHGNIFIDRNWNIKYMIDLEWTCSLPLEELMPPYWLTNQCIDELEDSKYELFKIYYNQFTEIFEQEAANTPLFYNGKLYSLVTFMKSALEDGRFWYLHALNNPKSLFNIFRVHLKPFYDKVPKETLSAAVSPFWAPDMTTFVGLKLEGLPRYHQEVRDIFNSRKSGMPRF